MKADNYHLHLNSCGLIISCWYVRSLLSGEAWLLTCGEEQQSFSYFPLLVSRSEFLVTMKAATRSEGLSKEESVNNKRLPTNEMNETSSARSRMSGCLNSCHQLKTRYENKMLYRPKPTRLKHVNPATPSTTFSNLALAAFEATSRSAFVASTDISCECVMQVR